jgi:SWI/SNF complex component SWP82
MGLEQKDTPMDESPAEAVPETEAGTPLPLIAPKEPTPTDSATPSTLSDIEKSLPENTPENPQPTVIKITEADLQEHTNYLRNFSGAKERTRDIKPFVDTEKVNEFNDGYEYIAKDPLGEQKVSENGFLAGGRKYLFTTFTLPGKGKRLYVLPTEAAKVLSYRDSFILFLRNKSLFRTICDDEDRKFLDSSGFNISKIKSRSVALINAKSLFVAYGARVIIAGKRVTDDYWEEQLTEQGFTPSDAVFPHRRRLGPRKKKTLQTINKVALIDPKLKLKLPTVSYVSPLPPLEARIEYLTSSSEGGQSQVLPGQGITGGLELASVTTIPKYRNESSNTTKQKNMLSSLTTSSTVVQPVIPLTGNSLPVDEKLAGSRAINGLPYYNPSISKRIAAEDNDKLNEIEYLHSTVEANHLISVGRTARNRQWDYYWQVRSGTTPGLTKDGASEFLEEREKFINEVQLETRYNEYLRSDQIISKKRKPNPNFLGHGNITGLKAPYLDKTS